MGLLEFDPLEPPPGAPMPLSLPGARDFEPPLPGAPPRAAEYLFASPSELWRLSWREGFREDVTGRHMTADLRFRTSLAALPRSGMPARGFPEPHAMVLLATLFWDQCQ